MTESHGEVRQGLDVGGHVLIAKAHLVKAEQMLGKPNQKGYQDAAYWVWQGIICTRKALKELRKDELCKKS